MAGEIWPPPSFGRRSSASKPASRRSEARWIGWNCSSKPRWRRRSGASPRARAAPAARRPFPAGTGCASRALALGMRERDLGVLQQRRRILAVRGRDRAADADRSFDVPVAQVEGLAERGDDAPRGLRDLPGAAHDLRRARTRRRRGAPGDPACCSSVCRRRATCRRISSPAAGPSVSLISLKRLMSIVCTDDRAAERDRLRRDRA